MSKQVKRKETLIEYMGLKDPDLHLPDHDTWCMKIYNNKELCRDILKKYIDIKPGKNIRDIYVDVEKDDVVRNVSLINRYNVLECDGSGCETKIARDIECDVTYSIDEEKIELEHVLTKKSNNGWAQRHGFLDVFYRVKLDFQYDFTIKGKKYNRITSNVHQPINLFFEIKTKKQTIGSIAREVEYYRNIMDDIYPQSKNIPIVISPEKIPIDQFDSFSFDDILKMEKVHIDDQKKVNA
jgi:hypothetical protein